MSGSLLSRPALTQSRLWPWVRLLRRQLYEGAVRNLIWASQHHPKAFLSSDIPSLPFLSSHVCALPYTPLMKILILQLDFLAWPQTCLAAATCLAITGMWWPWLLPSDLLFSSSSLAAVGLCLFWRTLPCLLYWPTLQHSQLLLPPEQEIQKPIYRPVFLCCSFRQRVGFQLLKSSNILEFVRHIWKLGTKNILILKISSLETVLPFLHDGYLSFYSLSFDISSSLLKSLFEISHSWSLPKVCSILQMVAYFLWPPDSAFCHSYSVKCLFSPFYFFTMQYIL